MAFIIIFIIFFIVDTIRDICHFSHPHAHCPPPPRKRWVLIDGATLGEMRDNKNNYSSHFWAFISDKHGVLSVIVALAHLSSQPNEAGTIIIPTLQIEETETQRG